MSQVTCDMDPAFVAKRLRLYRQLHGLTQENLADMCGLNRRSIENYESGRRAPDNQACRSLLRGMNVDPDFFVQPTPDEEARSLREMEAALKNTAVVPVERVASVQQVYELVAGCDGRRVDFSEVHDDALDLAAELEELITDWADIWEDIPAKGRLDAAREILDTVRRLEEQGFTTFYGRHLERRRVTHDKAIPMRSLVLLAMPKDSPVKHAILRLGPGSEPIGESIVNGT